MFTPTSPTEKSSTQMKASLYGPRLAWVKVAHAADQTSVLASQLETKPSELVAEAGADRQGLAALS